MTASVRMLGTSLKLDKGQSVTVTPATNLPQGGFFASPADGSWGEDSIRVSREEFRPAEPIHHNTVKRYIPNGLIARIAIECTHPVTGGKGSFLFSGDNPQDPDSVHSPAMDYQDLIAWAKGNGWDQVPHCARVSFTYSGPINP